MSELFNEVFVQLTIVRAANEGIPTAAIARIVQRPFDEVCEALTLALDAWRISSMPRADWPPDAKWSERSPAVPRSANSEEVEFQCRKIFKVTNLEAGFMMALLRLECADKERLHGVIEQQRHSRAHEPDSMELTDPKMVDVMICKLRKKVGVPLNMEGSAVIKTSWGKGYYIEPDVKKAIYELLGSFGGTYGARNATEKEITSETSDGD